MIINFAPYNKYLYSPYLYLHKVNCNYKLYFILIYLFIIIFYPRIIIIFIVLNIILYISILKYLKLKYKYLQLFYQKTFQYIILLLITIIINNKKFLEYFSCLIIYYPYIKICYLQLIIGLKSLYIPTILFKIFYILHISIGLLNILFSTTKLENIHTSCLYIFFRYKKIDLNLNNAFIFSCCLSSYFIYTIVNKFQDYFLSIKLRKIYKYNKRYIIYFFYLIFFIKNIKYDVESITDILYQREIINKDFYLINFE